MFKKILAKTMVACILFSGVLSFSVSAAPVTMTKSAQLASYVFDGYGSAAYGPISITSGTLFDGYSYSNVFLIALSGTDTDIKEGQATGVVADFNAAFSISDAYVAAVKNAIYARGISANSKLVIAGHSLGGMVAQQVAADSWVKDNFQVINTVTFGSPLITFINREGSVKRLGDTGDLVPYLTVASLFLITNVWNSVGLNQEDGGYGLNFIAAHNDSYRYSYVWDSYDVLGVKYGTAKYTYDNTTRLFYRAPIY